MAFKLSTNGYRMKLSDVIQFKKNARLLLLAGVTGLLTAGCQTYQQQNKVIVDWRNGQLNEAADRAKTLADKNANNRNAIIWRLEEGAVLRAVGRYADSNQAFDQAEGKIDDYAAKAKVRVGQEAGALISNQATLDYEGRSYDGIMLDTYKALNYLALGEVDKARPELIHAYQRQQDAVAANKKRIADAQDAANQNQNAAAIQRTQNDPQLQSQLSNATTDLNSMKAYANYVNPFTVYLDGLFFMADANDASDLERARKSFERVSQFAPDNIYVKQDLTLANDLMAQKSLLPTTYVIFETGCAPERSQIRIDVPILISRVSYVGVAFPTLKFQSDFMPSLMVVAGNTSFPTESVCSMDSVIASDFKNEQPAVITKTITATVIKAAAAYAANAAANQAGGDLGGILAQIGTAVYEAAVNIADERTWTTLPKEIQVARVPTPADRKIDLITPSGVKTSVNIEPGTINVVYVKSINALTPMLVSQFKLK